MTSLVKKNKSSPNIINKLLWRWIMVISVVTLILTLVASFKISFWLFDLCTHFRLQYGIAMIICFLYFLFIRYKIGIAITAIALVINIGAIAPYYLPQQEILHNTTPLKLLMANVNSSNTQYSLFLDLVRQANPDIIVIQEISEGWKKALTNLNSNWPQHKVIPRPDNFGIALYSKIPLEQLNVVPLGRSEVPAIEASFKLNNKKIQIFAVHTLPPMSARYFDLRNGQMQEISQWIQQQQEPCVLIGDLNCSMWSPYFEKLLQDSQLKNVRQGFGILPSWPAKTAMIRIPIDHCLVDHTFQVNKTYLGPFIGSDHLPLIVELFSK